MTMTTNRSDYLPGLGRRTNPRKLKPPTPTARAVDAWRAAWAAKYGHALVPPTNAAWLELKRHAKKIAELLPDEAERDAFFRWYLAIRDPYIGSREHPLRLALVAGRLEHGLAEARRAVAERRRVEAATANAKAQALPVHCHLCATERGVAIPAPGTCPHIAGPKYARWEIRLLDAAGAVVRTGTIRASSEDAAGRIASLWLFDAGAAASRVEVSRV